jgi:hypothetical protein
MLASYSATKKNIPVPRNSAYNPNSEINAADTTWEWLFRGTGSYLFPFDVQVSSNLLVQSGFVWARTVSMTGGAQIPSIVLFAEETGARQTPTQTTLALGVEKRINLQGGRRLAVALQFLNVLNANFDIELPQTRGGPELGYSINTVPPRVGELTIRYSF